VFSSLKIFLEKFNSGRVGGLPLKAATVPKVCPSEGGGKPKRRDTTISRAAGCDARGTFFYYLLYYKRFTIDSQQKRVHFSFAICTELWGKFLRFEQKKMGAKGDFRCLRGADKAPPPGRFSPLSGEKCRRRRQKGGRFAASESWQPSG